MARYHPIPTFPRFILPAFPCPLHMGMHTHVHIFTLLLSIFNHPTMLLYEPPNSSAVCQVTSFPQEVCFCRDMGFDSHPDSNESVFLFFQPICKSACLI